MKRTSILLPLFLLSSSFTHAKTVIQASDDDTITIIAPQKPTSTSINGAKTIINDKQISVRGFTSLAQTLQQSGRLQLTDTSGSGSQASISLRGFGSNADSNSLILINGIPVTNPDLAPINLNIIPLQDISRVVISAGTESVLYGDQAVGGVVNIYTNDTNPDTTRLSCQSGSFNQYGCNMSFSNTLESNYLHMTANTTHTDNYRDHNNYDQQHATVTFNYPHERGDIRTDINILNENLQYPGALTSNQVRNDRRQASNSNDYFKDINGNIQIIAHQQVGDNSTIETAAAHRQMNGNGVLYSEFTQSRSSDYFKPSIKINFDHVNFISGLDYQHDQYQLNSLYGKTESIQQKYGVFTSNTIPWLNSNAFTLGLRAAEQSSNLASFTSDTQLNRALATEIGYQFTASPEMSFYAKRATSFRFPKADENASTTPQSGGLRTQRGISYESGFKFNRDKQQVMIDIYQLSLKDEIAFDPLQTPQTPFGSNQNLSPTQRRGISISGNTDINSYLSADAQYNIVSAQFIGGTYAGNHIPLVANNLMHAGMQFNYTDNWHAYLEANHTGSQYAANDFTNQSGSLGGYTTYAASLQYQRKAVTATLRADNLTNKEYYFYSVVQQGSEDTFFYPAPTRSVMLSVDYVMA